MDGELLEHDVADLRRGVRQGMHREVGDQGIQALLVEAVDRHLTAGPAGELEVGEHHRQVVGRLVVGDGGAIAVEDAAAPRRQDLGDQARVLHRLGQALALDQLEVDQAQQEAADEQGEAHRKHP
jgi:hypothetical protein